MYAVRGDPLGFGPEPKDGVGMIGRTTRRVTASLIAGLALMLGSAGLAHAEGRASSYTVDATIDPDGALKVTETIDFAGAAPATLVQELSTRTRTADARAYYYAISDIAAEVGGAPAASIDTKVAATSTRISVPTGGASQVKLSYTVRGAAVVADDETQISWPLLQGLSVPVETFEATIHAPAAFTMIDCAAGAPAAPSGCTFYGGGTHEYPNPYFRDERRGAGEVVVAILRFPATAIPANQDLRDLWTLDRAFSTDPLPLAVAAGTAVIGALVLWLLHRRVGRDASAVAPQLVASFAPTGAGQVSFETVDGVRPGEIGTLADERVDPIDITASVLDLAVRGHLLITELERESAHAPAQWTFARRRHDGPLLDYERTLLDAVAPVQGDPVLLTNLAGSVASSVGQIQSELYEEVVERGWFARRPDTTRNRWTVVGWVAVALAVSLTVALAAFTHFGLAGLVTIALALGLIFVAQELPARTTSGRAVLAGLDVLRGSLLTQPVDQLPIADRLAQVSRLLPYAVVLGGRERWLAALADADDDDQPDSEDLDWYHGPSTWQLADLPASLNSFVTTVQGVLFSR
ncbi:putative membrane protein DUF2207 [Propionicimonas paludicola]|uniref:Putative membrane protein DUF2207 n=2 Tax=Propionicimonas paludicola TaxID=185243 RepID=A0A2A9CNI9_9ACTN|nr:putative membrane protein DUF2207 [Propionicimonas paludicola]